MKNQHDLFKYAQFCTKNRAENIQINNLIPLSSSDKYNCSNVHGIYTAADKEIKY